MSQKKKKKDQIETSKNGKLLSFELFLDSSPLSWVREEKGQDGNCLGAGSAFGMGQPSVVTELPPGLSVKGRGGKDRMEVTESEWQS